MSTLSVVLLAVFSALGGLLAFLSSQHTRKENKRLKSRLDSANKSQKVRDENYLRSDADIYDASKQWVRDKRNS